MKLAEPLATQLRGLRQKRPLRALLGILQTWLLCAVGWYLLWVSPWYLWPFLWLFQGVALAGLWLLAHEAAHYTLVDSRWGNTLWGHIFCVPIFHPFVGLRYFHQAHHQNTNGLKSDTFWAPLDASRFHRIGKFKQAYYKILRTWGLPLGTLTLLVARECRPKQLPASWQRAGYWSCLWSIVTGGALATWVVYFGGWQALLVVVVVPFITFHGVFSLISLLHHTTSEVFAGGERVLWHQRRRNPPPRQAAASLYLSFPGWLSVMMHHIDWHFPHHFDQNIPFYNLPKAQKLFAAEGFAIKSIPFRLQSAGKVLGRCHLIEPGTQHYLSFKEAERRYAKS